MFFVDFYTLLLGTHVPYRGSPSAAVMSEGPVLGLTDKLDLVKPFY